MRMGQGRYDHENKGLPWKGMGYQLHGLRDQQPVDAGSGRFHPKNTIFLCTSGPVDSTAGLSGDRLIKTHPIDV